MADSSNSASNQLLLPDGTTVPVLNGAYGAPKLLWPRERPWSPIIKKYRDKDGVDWYEHEDGSRTITSMVYNSQYGKKVPFTTLYNPVDSLPIDPDELENMRREKEKAGQSKGQSGKPKTPGKK